MTVMNAVSRHEPDREAVDAEVVADVEALDPGVLLDELHRRRAEVEAGDERDRDEEARERRRSAPPSAPRRRARRGRTRAAARRRRSAARSRGSEAACSCCSLLRSAADHAAEEGPQLPGHQADHADDHDQRVPVEIAGLQAAAQRGDAADRPRRAVDEDAVDDADVAALPQARADAGARRAASTFSLNQSM